ncbi:RINT1-like protein MAG2 [Linum perenne]
MAKLIMKSTLTLPPSVILSSSVVTFLNGRFNDQQDLEQASAIVLELQSQCVDIDQSLTAINSRVQSSLLAYASFSDRIHSLVTDTTSKLTDLGSLTSASSSFSGQSFLIFNDQQDLEQASAIVLELQSQCVDLDQSLTAINSRVQSSLLAYASFSDRIHSLVTDTTSKLTDLGSLTSASSSFPDYTLDY